MRPKLAVPARPAFVGPLATLPVYWTVTGRLLTESTPGRKPAKVSLPLCSDLGCSDQVTACRGLGCGRRRTRGAMRPADMTTTSSAMSATTLMSWVSRAAVPCPYCPSLRSSRPPTDLSVRRNLFASGLGASVLMLTPSHSTSHTGVKDTSLTSNPEAEWLDMTRTIPHSLAPVLEQLELYQADLVTTARLDELVRTAGIRTATRTVATRLRSASPNRSAPSAWTHSPAPFPSTSTSTSL